MKKLKKITLNKLEGEKLSNQELKLIVGGSNHTSCSGSGCQAIYSSGMWVGCAAAGSGFCVYG
ncbi:TIGR04149 family rSAM-modified RiPP [uncultured Parabacteroides sp.]|uniref:TIGR04149 family rSAM-modified RiPP n=1 Tax=uncultured Parabacteroides sp. TaxID=512312 RepID=UPI0025E678B1|nr:TIGR04149 family rSAM-modified RiPP [uncultured Parabacteroides sp.]